jgi:putative toxin-antitoxin system antitoxin component (TIGR02293 family)
MASLIIENAVSKPLSQTDDIDVYVSRMKSGERGSDHLYVLLLGIRTLETKKLRREIEKGFSIRVLEHLQRILKIPMPELTDLMQINYRTLNRRKVSGRLNPDESDRVLRVSRVFARCLELFEGDQAAARHWFLSPQKGLGDQSPAATAKTEFGALEVERLVGRLEHGVFV